MNVVCPAPAAILFDLDGTLVDSLPDMRTAINRVLAERGGRPITATEIRQAVGHGAAHLVELCCRIAGVPLGDALPDVLSRYLACYEEDLVIESRPYPGVPAMLQDLRDSGVQLGICTNKPTHLAVQLVSALGLAAHFAVISGGDAVARRKPHGDHPRAALAAMALPGRDDTRVLFVGDSENDVAAARAAGMPVALVRFGYALGDVDALGADLVIDSFEGFAARAQAFLSP